MKISRIDKDQTPEDFQLPVVGRVERYFKRSARRILYPFLPLIQGCLNLRGNIQSCGTL